MTITRLAFAVLLVAALGPAQTSARVAAAGPGDMPVLYAEARMDCAPWDGAAFSLAIQPEAGQKQLTPPVLRVSIWQSPNLPLGARFAFPDSTGKVGAAYLQPSTSDAVTGLRGTVWFTKVVAGEAAQGQFDLADPRGKKYVGAFTAKWIMERVMCG
jgi:hypothetical protein